MPWKENDPKTQLSQKRKDVKEPIKVVTGNITENF